MTGAIIVTLFVYGIVVAFLAIVNHFLRSDEFWKDGSVTPPPPEPKRAPAPAQRFQHAKA